MDEYIFYGVAYKPTYNYIYSVPWFTLLTVEMRIRVDTIT